MTTTRSRKRTTAVIAAGLLVVGLAAAVPATAAAAKPTVTSVTPTSGIDRGGELVTVNGTNFTRVTKVLFGSTAGTKVKVLSTKKLEVRAPKHAAGTVDIRVQAKAGTSKVVAKDKFAYRPAPSITSLSPARGPKTGGQRVTITGSGFYSPLSVTVGGTAATAVKVVSTKSIQVTTPAHAAGLTDVLVRTPYDNTTEFESYYFGGWRGPQNLDKLQGGPTRVSCAESLCMAIDFYGKVALRPGPTSAWSAPTLLAPGVPMYIGSCASARRCVAMTRRGDAYTYDGTSWKSSPVVPATTVDKPYIADVSCAPSTLFCVAPGSDGVMYSTSDGGVRWNGRSKLAEATAWVVELSCVSATYCLGTGRDDEVYEFDGTGWTRQAATESSPTDILSVSCPAVRVCTAVAAHGDTFRQTAEHGWIRTPIGTDEQPIAGESVSCTDVHVCVTVGYDGTWQQTDDGPWERVEAIDADAEFGTVSSISCTTTTCVTIDDDGVGYDYDPQSGTASARQAIEAHTGLSMVSCARGGTVCAAANDGRFAYVRVKGSWTTVDPQAFSASRNNGTDKLAGVSCATDSFCLAVSKRGAYSVWRSGQTSWSAPVDFASDVKLIGLSCGSATSCVAYDDHGVWAWDGTAWTGPQALETPDDRPVVAVSCVPDGRCVAVAAEGTWFTRSGTTWTTHASFQDSADQSQVGDVSCSSVTSCVALAGSAPYTFTGSTWTRYLFGNRYGRNVSCVSNTRCVVLLDLQLTYTGIGKSWQVETVERDFDRSLISLSCSSATSCLAGDSNGKVFTYSA